MNLNVSLEDKGDFPVLYKVGPWSTAEELKQFVLDANALAYAYDRVIALPQDAFWSTVAFNKPFIESFDSALSAIPKSYEKEEYAIIYCSGSNAASAATVLLQSAFAVFVRLTVQVKSRDATAPPQKFNEESKKALPMDRLIAACALFTERYPEAMSKLLKKKSFDDVEFTRNVSSYGRDVEKSLTLLEETARSVADAFFACDDAHQLQVARLVDELLAAAVDALQSYRSLVDSLKSADVKVDFSSWLTRLPTLTENLAACFPHEALVRVAAALPSYPLRLEIRSAFTHFVTHRRLLRLINACDRAAAELFVAAVRGGAPAAKLSLVKPVLARERFLYVLNDHSNLSALLSDCPRQEVANVERAVLAACESQTSHLLRLLQMQGLLNDLGELNRLKAKDRESLDEISQILSHLSIEYLHLCLRHFDYDSTATMEALLTRDTLPLQLRRLETVNLTPFIKLSSEESPSSSMPVLSFENEDIMLSLLRARAERVEKANERPNVSATNVQTSNGKDDASNAFRGMFSMAPSAAAEPKPGEESATVAEVSKAEQNEALEKLTTMLDIMNLGGAPSKKEFEAQEGPNGEKLVPMMTARKYAGVNAFKTPAADKVALRPFYEKYKFETPDEEFDVYDDEYDDGYEQKEFNVEHVESGDSSTDDEVAGFSSAATSAPPGFQTKNPNRQRRTPPQDQQQQPGGPRSGPQQQNQQRREQPAGSGGAAPPSSENYKNQRKGRRTPPQDQKQSQQQGSQQPTDQRTGKSQPQHGGGGQPKSRPPQLQQDRRGNRNDETRDGDEERPPRNQQQGGGAPQRGGRGGGRGGGGQQRGGGQAGGNQQRNAPPPMERQQSTESNETDGGSTATAASGGRGGGRGGSRTTTYHGGRDRQMKERHKNEFKQRGADRKMRGGMI